MIGVSIDWFYGWLLLSTIALVSLAAYAWQKNSAPGAVYFGWAALVGAVWCFFYLNELLSPTLPRKLFWHSFQYVDVLIPPLLMVFAARYTNRMNWLRGPALAVLAVHPLLTGLILLFNFPSGWLFASEPVFTFLEGIPVIQYLFGPWMWISYFYSGLLLLAGLAVLSSRLAGASRYYRLQLGALIAGLVLPAFPLALMGFRFSLFPSVIIFPLAFSVGAFLIALGLFRYRLLDLVPVARDVLIEKLQDGVLVFDSQGRIIDLNEAAQEILGLKIDRVFSLKLDQVQPTIPQRVRDGLYGLRDDAELSFGNPARTFQVLRSAMPGQYGRKAGQVVALHDITPFKELETALRSSEEKYRTVVEKGNDGIVFVQDGRVQYCNQQLADLLGYSLVEVIGSAFDQLLAPEMRGEVLTRHYRRLLGEDVPYRYEIEGVHKDGNRVPVEVNARLVQFDSNPAVLAFVRDIRQQKQASRLLEESREQYRDLYLHAQSHAIDLERLYSLEQATLDSTRDGIMVVGLDGMVIVKNMRFEQLWGLQPGWETLSSDHRQQMLLKHVKNQSEVLDRIQWINEHAHEEILDQIDLTDGRTLERYSVPYQIGSQIIGRLWSFRDVTERRRAEEAEFEVRQLMETRASELEQIKQLAETLNEHFPPRRALEEGLRLVVERIQAESGWILTTRTTGESVLVASYQLPEELKTYQGTTRPWGWCGCLEMIMDREPDFLGPILLPCDRLARLGRSLAHLTMPVQARGKTVGVLNLELGAGASFDDADLRLLSAFGAQFGGALERDRLFTETHQALEREKRLSEVAHAINSAFELPEILQRVARLSAELVGAESGVVILLTPDLHELEVAAAFNTSSKLFAPGMRIPKGEGFCWQVIEKGTPLQFEHGQQPAWLYPGLTDDSIRSLMASPLLMQGTPSGLLLVYTADPELIFSSHHLLLLETVAGQAALAIQKASLFEQVHHLAVTDSLTGLFTRRHFYDLAEREIDRSRRYGRPFTLLMADVDHFKAINDRFGHLAGDQALQIMAKICLEVLRQVDLVCRYGGEEIVVLLPETSPEEALQAAERLRETIEQIQIDSRQGPIHLTVSIGIVSLTPDQDIPLDGLLECADQALYQAKAGGRNRVQSWSASDLPSERRVD